MFYQDILIKSLAGFQNGQNCCFATVIEVPTKGTPQKPGAKMVVFEDGTTFSTIGGGETEKEVIQHCLEAIKKKKTKLLTFDFTGKDNQPVCGGCMKIFIEPLIRQKRLIICGAGHIAWPLSLIAKLMNYKITIIDNRREFANKKRFPHADQIICGHPAKKISRLKITQNDCIIILTPNHKYDYACLAEIINSHAGFIGVIGSHAKRLKFIQDLKKNGTSQKIINQMHMPIGLDIGAQTPEEIAVSIMAEIISFENAKYIGSIKFKKKHI